LASILVLSQNLARLTFIEELAEEAEIRIKTTASRQTALEWVKLQDFLMFLVDATLSEVSPITVVKQAWDIKPLLSGSIFCFDDQLKDEWAIRLAGIRVFAGENARDQIKNSLSDLAKYQSDLSSGKVLYVEDLDAPRDIICNYIEGLGFQNVEGAKSARDALEKLRNNPSSYLCVVSDINMPEVTGIEFLAEMRKDFSLKNIPVLMLTAYAQPDNLVECIKAGATGFLVKPPRKRQLKRELEKAARIRREHREPRLCSPDDAERMEDALHRYLSGSALEH